MRSRRFVLAVVPLVAAMAALVEQPRASAQTPPRGSLSRYVAADFYAAIVIHPARVAKSPLWADLPKSEMGAMPLAGMQGMDPAQVAALAEELKKLDPSSVRRVVFLMEGKPQAKEGGALIVQFEDNASQKWADLLAKGGEPAEAEGTKYAKFKTSDGQEIGVCVADPKILLVAPEPSLKKMLAMPAGPQPLLEELRRVSLENDVIVALVSAGLLTAAGDELPPPAKGILMGLQSASATLNFSGDTLLRVDLVAAEEGAAAALQMQLNMFHGLGTQQVQEMKKQPSPMMPPELSGVLFPALEEMMAGTKISKDGLRVTADMKMPSKLAELLKALQSVMTFSTQPAGMPGAPPAEPPAEPAAKPAN